MHPLRQCVSLQASLNDAYSEANSAALPTCRAWLMPAASASYGIWFACLFWGIRKGG